jgi:xanthine dehydrogenase YagS FAD-binding subunit
VNRFELAHARSLGEARELVAQKAGAVLKAGGIDLLDHMKEHLVEPPRIVNLKSIPGLNQIRVEADGSLRIGTLATLAQVAAHEGIARSHPALAQACGEAASPQIRNVATIGGSVLQRPRCWYYRLESYRCLKKGGDVCYAVNGENRYLSIFGGGPSYATHPSNAAVALVALNATLALEGARGKRTVPAGDFFTLPGKDPQSENQLGKDEILTEIRVPSAAGARSVYDEVRERAAFDWPLVSVAAALKSSGGVIREARVILGAVAPIPWRSTSAEQALVGKGLNDATAAAAAQAAITGAAPLSDNGYKVGLVQMLVRRTLLSVA